MPGLKSQRQPEKRRQVLGHAKGMPGLRFRTEICMLRVAKAWPRPCPSAVQASCALNSAFPSRPLGFNSGEEGSDSLDTSGEYALAEPGKPRRRRPYEKQLSLSMVLQRLRHKSRRRLMALALMPWALGHLGLDGQAIYIWPPC